MHKPFNLAEAKLGAPIQTKGGETMKFISHEPNAREDQRVVVLSSGIGGFRRIALYNEEGIAAGTSSPLSDLEMKKRKVTRWMNVLAPDQANQFPKVRWYVSEADAKTWASTTCIAVAVPMEYEE